MHLPLRMLLTTHGSVTGLLEASVRAPVAVETITNAVDGARSRSLRRTAVLRLAADGRPLQRSPGAPAWAVGVLMAGLFTGAILGPLAVGFLAGQERFAVAWGTCAGCAFLAALTVWATRQRLPRLRPRQ